MPGILAVLGGVIGGIGISIVSVTMRPVYNAVNQKAFQVLPNELLPPANLINLRYRGHISAPVYHDEMLRQGIDGDRADKLYHGSESLLNGYEIIALWRRGGLTEVERNAQLTELGFTHDRISMLTDVTAQIPSALDVIGFAVREVYSPVIAAAFGQYEGVEEVLDVAADDIQASGMTNETFKKYWAAHWQLPSMRQGYEMLHRDVIDADTLDHLMVALDIMPYWRDKLREISYAPYTRVDVRRMHKLGILDEDGLIRAYMDLGYDQERAEGLAEFTVLYNLDPEAHETTEEDEAKKGEKEATRTSVMKAFRTGVISEGEVREYLTALGYRDQAVELYIANALFTIEEDIEDDIIETIHTAYVRRIYDFNTTIQRLGALNLPAKRGEALINKWSIEKEAKLSRPSKAELFKLLAGKIITQDELKTELAGHGYTEKYIAWYLKLAGAKG